MALFFKSAIVLGDRQVEVKLMSTRAVVREVIGVRLARIAEAFDAARMDLIPKVTGRAASSLFSEISYDRTIPRIFMQAGYHSDIAPYVDFLDFGSGIHHVPDPHPPWIQRVEHRRTVRILARVAPFTEPSGSMGGLLEMHMPSGSQNVIHYGQRPLLFTEEALALVRPIYTAEMRTAGPEIARRIG